VAPTTSTGNPGSRISCSTALAENHYVRLSSQKVACSSVVPTTSTGNPGSVYTHCETALAAARLYVAGYQPIYCTYRPGPYLATEIRALSRARLSEVIPIEGCWTCWFRAAPGWVRFKPIGKSRHEVMDIVIHCRPLPAARWSSSLLLLSRTKPIRRRPTSPTPAFRWTREVCIARMEATS
jgi:hypothetical protein